MKLLTFMERALSLITAMDQRLLLLLTCLLITAIHSTRAAALVDHQEGPDRVRRGIMQPRDSYLRRVKRGGCGMRPGACSTLSFFCSCDEFLFRVQRGCECICRRIQWNRECAPYYGWLDVYYDNY